MTTSDDTLNHNDPQHSPVLAYMRTLPNCPPPPRHLTPILWDSLLLPLPALSRRLGRYHYYCAQELMAVPAGRFAVDPQLCDALHRSVYKRGGGDQRVVGNNWGVMASIR